MTWEQFRKSTANAQTEEHARELFAGLVCDSGRVMCEVGFPWLDRGNAATVNYSAITTPVLVLAGECDRILLPRIARQTAARYTQATYVEIPHSDHMVFSGEALPDHDGPHRRLDRKKPRADHRLASQLPGTTAPRLTPSPVHSTGRSAPIRGATLDRAQATANAPSTPAAVLIALGDGGQAESSGPRNECQVRWLCDLRRHCRHPKALWRCSCCRPLGPDLRRPWFPSPSAEHVSQPTCRSGWWRRASTRTADWCHRARASDFFEFSLPSPRRTPQLFVCEGREDGGSGSCPLCRAGHFEEGRQGVRPGRRSGATQDRPDGHNLELNDESDPGVA